MFTSRRADDETALYYYRARYYAFDIGRFLQSDPIGYVDGLNLYTYCANNPLIWIDPYGLCKGGGSYLQLSLLQFILGNYTEDVTLLGTGAQVATGLAGIDIPCDIRDIYYDLRHWESSWGHAGQTALDVISFIPVVGSAKFSDEIATLVKHGGKNADEAAVVLKQYRGIEGVYEFTASSGKNYVGQSQDTGRRLLEHLRQTHKLNPGDIDTIKVKNIPNSTVEIRKIAEQTRINELGGKETLENIRNAIKEADWEKCGIDPPQ